MVGMIPDLGACIGRFSYLFIAFEISRSDGSKALADFNIMSRVSNCPQHFVRLRRPKCCLFSKPSILMRSSGSWYTPPQDAVEASLDNPLDNPLDGAVCEVGASNTVRSARSVKNSFGGF